MSPVALKRFRTFLGALLLLVASPAWAQPDLRPTGLTAPASAVTQHTMEISWTVENGGTAEAKASWYDIVYFSADEVLSGEDVALAQGGWTEAVAAGGTYNLARTVTVPSVPAGNYYLILRVEALNYLYESDEGNNQRVATVEIKTPDLRPTGLTAPASAVTQHTMEISWTVENRGNGEAKASWYDIVYFSADEVLSGEDVALAQGGWTEAVAAGGTYNLARTVTVPSVPAGNYYLILRVEALNYLYESDEGNNQRVATVEIKTPDLRPTGLTAPASAVTQHTMEISWTVENRGNGEAKASWYDIVYFSADEVLSGEDVALAQGGWTEAVAAGGTYNLARTVTVPSVPAGNYYLILRVEALNYLYESDEGNNQRVATVEIRTPDLRPTGLTAPASAVTQHTMEISWTVENRGNGEAKASWYDIVYFSADEVLSGEDVALAQGGWTEAVAAGGTYNLARTVTVPSVPAGNYYLILRVEALNYLYESDEGNNQRVATVEIRTPDLRPTGLTAPASAVTQHTMEISWTVENRGNGEAKASWYDIVYFSADEVLSGEDVALAQGGWTEAVAAGGTYNLARTVTVPSVPAGNYYLILRVEALNYLYESDEGNNQRVATVEIRTPDLRPTGLTAPASAVTQHTMEISWTVENRGNGEAKASWYDIVYFSADEVLSGEDVALAQGGWTEAVAAGGTYNLARTVTVPSVPAGNYYLILRVEALNYLYESDEGNNEFRRPIQVTGSETLRIVAIESRPNGRLRLEFQSISGPSHHLESCDFIEEGLWVGESFYIAEDAAETVEQIEGTGDIMSIYVSPAGVRRFYRMAAP